MVAGLLFGEILRFRIGFRVLLCGIGFLVAMVGNLVRTVFLSLIAVTHGTEATEQWHDSAGVSILLATIGALGVVAWLFQGRGVPTKPPSSVPGDFARWKPVYIGTCAVLLAAWAGTEAWFRMHELSSNSTIAWHFVRRGIEHGATPTKIPSAAMDTLRYPEGFSETWRDGGGRRWQWFYFRWLPGRTATQVTRVHNPTVCLPGVGMTLEKELPTLTYQTGDLRILFHAYHFTDRGIPLYVFHSISEDFSAYDAAPAPDGYEIQSRLRAVVEGRRNRGQRLLEFAVSGARDSQDAETALRNLLDESITIEPSGSGSGGVVKPANPPQEIKGDEVR
jgi:exosortase/archaeosortase family protein